ncbi:MAG: hypothetical protein KJT03_20640, partial [Verrucomicrobiae bacterium]|nr:hypothetical protein [Verrucomicrobiae bacterium]
MNLMKIAWRRLCLPVLIVTRIGLSGQNTPVSLPDSLDGQTLAGIFCVSCHVVPEPDLLTKESWQYLLTYMGFFLGVADYSYMEGSSERTMDNIHAREEFVRTAAMFPAQPLLSGDQWKRIREYYMEAAPLKPVPQKAKPAILEDETLFKVKQTQYRQKSAVTSMVRIDEEHG